MKKYKSIKYRIYPNKKQQSLILKTFGCCRFVYNYMLERSIEAHENGEFFCTRNSFNYLLTSLKKEFIWLKEVDSIEVATVSQSSDGKFYASVLFEYESDVSYQVDLNNAIGLDYASNGLFVDSNGKRGTNYKFYRKAQKKLAKEQRRLSRKDKGSKNYYKQLLAVNKLYRHIANQKNDNLHKLSTEIANLYDVVCVEDLNMTAIGNKGFKNGKATYDNGYGMFLDMLEYKLSDRGKILVKVDKFYPSSQLCSCCGNRKKLELSERKYICSCGLEIDRDLNAAINIKNEGLRLLA